MNLTTKRLADWLTDKKNAQLFELRNKHEEELEILRDQELEKLGLTNFYIDFQDSFDRAYGDYKNILDRANEKNAIKVTSYGGLRYHLGVVAGENKMKNYDRNSVQIDTEVYRALEYSQELEIDKIKTEWIKLIGTVRARKSVNQALAYLHELGIVTKEIETFYQEKQEPMLPATIINLSLLKLEEDEDK